MFFSWLIDFSDCSLSCFLNFKGNTDNERFQMVKQKIPFKYNRPVEEWLQEKGNHR